MKNQLCFLIVFLFSITIFSQENKSFTIKRTNTAPKIDAVLDDDAWKNSEEVKDFIQFRPAMGVTEKEHQKTIVKLSYNDEAIFIAAYLHDKPEDIMKQFTTRDNFGQSDFFGVVLNPNNDALNGSEFFVFSSGTQADALVTNGNNEDFGWNAVWDSEVKIVDDGWIVEMKIPYSALRFSNQEIQTWEINFHRHFRTDRSQYSWSPIDRTKGNIGLYHGKLEGIQNIQPPTRLSFYPFVSGIYSSFDGESVDDYKIGLDAKYGISENFTLDVTLIPDFSQAGFDDVQLNLGPFEQQFSEQRQFFTEGVDLFNKGNLFYSRRIGNTPIEFGNVYSELINTPDEFEEVVDNPTNAKLLNAVKVSGRTKKGLGIGFFNAITEKTEATIKNTRYELNPNTNVNDTIITYRNRVTEPLTNYNIFVLDQQFNKNSSISLINTNVTRDGHFRDANTTGLLLDLVNKKNTFGLEAEAKMSSLNLNEGTETGYSAEIEIGDVSGQYQYSFGYSFMDENYNINDFGILRRNNYSNFSADFSYRIFEPTEKLNSFSINSWFNYTSLFKPNTYTSNNVGVNAFWQLKSLLAFGTNFNAQIGKQYDYFESRHFKPFIYENWLNGSGWVSTNYNKRFAFDLRVGFGTLFEDGRDLFNYNYNISPRYRFNDHFTLVYSYNYSDNNGNRGYVTDFGEDDIVIGERNQITIVNRITGSYNFNSFNELSITFRNYWSTVNYDYDLFTLQDNGRLINTGHNLDNLGFDPNINYNTWNLDLKYSWQFAPGSQLIALYRNSLFNSSSASEDDYFQSLNKLFDEPIQHVFSLRFIYYIDYNNIKSLLKKKNA